MADCGKKAETPGEYSSRQRMINTFEYTSPDRLPVVYHPSPAGLHVHGQKLLDLFRALPPDTPITFADIPHPAPGTVDDRGEYHELRRDAWGTTWEFRIFGIQGHPFSYPFSDWQAASSFVFPVVPVPGSEAEDQARERLKQLTRSYLVFGGGISLFEKLHALRPMDEVLIDLYTGDMALLVFLERLADYWEEVIAYHLRIGTDVIMFGDDWGAQQGPIVSPALFRDLFRPLYERLMAPIRQAGRRIFLHSCGRLGDIFQEFLDLGINGFWPQIGCYEEEELFGIGKSRQMGIYLHPDRQYLVPRGTPAEIRDTVRRYADRCHALGGGGIFYVEIENDAPWENVKALIEAIHTWR